MCRDSKKKKRLAELIATSINLAATNTNLNIKQSVTFYVLNVGSYARRTLPATFRNHQKNNSVVHLEILYL